MLEDGGLRTPARVFGRAGFGLSSGPDSALRVDLTVDDLALTSEPGGVLVPCYSELVEEARTRAAKLHGEIAGRIAGYVERLARGHRIGTKGATIYFDVDRLVVTSRADAPSARIRADLECTGPTRKRIPVLRIERWGASF